MRLLATLIVYEHQQPSLVAEALAVLIGLVVTKPSIILCRKSFDHASRFDFWQTQPPETRLRQLQVCRRTGSSSGTPTHPPHALWR